MVHRITHIPKNKHCFLFGARGTGKSTLVKQQFADEHVFWINLLDTEMEQLYALDPGRLVREILALSPNITHHRRRCTLTQTFLE